jgi:hypothetical protein
MGPPPVLVRAAGTTMATLNHEPEGDRGLLLQLSRTVERLEARLEQSEGIGALRVTRAGFQKRPGPFIPEILGGSRNYIVA